MSYDDEIDEREERAVERALEFAGDPLAERPRPAAENAEGETLTRIYVELLGLLPQELDAVPSPPGEKERLLSLVHGRPETSPAGPQKQEERALEPEPVGGVPPAAPAAPVDSLAPSAATPIASTSADPYAHYEPRGRRRGRWLLPVAAVLLVGLVGVSGWLVYQLQNQKAQVARLARELSFAQQQGANVAAMRNQMKELDHRLQLVTSPASEFCPLRPSGGQPLAPGASGVLFVGPNHQHWYLALYGLDPPPPGRTYQLWFVVDGKPVSVGTFSGKRGAKVEFASDTMPHNTNAVAVTLEPAGGMPQPTGPQVLQGDQMTPLG